MTKVILVDFDATLVAKKKNISENDLYPEETVYYNEDLIQTLIKAKKEGHIILGFTNWAHFNYANKGDGNRIGYFNSPARSQVVDQLKDRGLEFDAVVTTGTYYALLQELIKDIKPQDIPNHISKLNLDERLELLGEFFESIYKLEKDSNYSYKLSSDESAEYPKLIHDTLKNIEDTFEGNEDIKPAIEELNENRKDGNKLNEESKHSNKGPMFDIVNLILPEYNNIILFEDKDAVHNEAKERNISYCKVGMHHDGVVRKGIEYEHFLNLPNRAALEFNVFLNRTDNLATDDKLEISKYDKNYIRTLSLEIFEDYKRDDLNSFFKKANELQNKISSMNLLLSDGMLRNQLMGITEKIQDIRGLHPNENLNYNINNQIKMAELIADLSKRYSVAMDINGKDKLFSGISSFCNEVDRCNFINIDTFTSSDYYDEKDFTNKLIKFNNNLEDAQKNVAKKDPDLAEMIGNYSKSINAFYTEKFAQAMEDKKTVTNFANDNSIDLDKLQERLLAFRKLKPNMSVSGIIENCKDSPEILRLANYLDKQLYNKDDSSIKSNISIFNRESKHQSVEKVARDLFDHYAEGKPLTEDTQKYLASHKKLAISKIHTNIEDQISANNKIMPK